MDNEVEKAVGNTIKGKKFSELRCTWYSIYGTMLSKPVKVVTFEHNLQDAKAAGLDAGTSLQEAVDEALLKYGEDAKIAVVPYGRYTVLAG